MTRQHMGNAQEPSICCKYCHGWDPEDNMIGHTCKDCDCECDCKLNNGVTLGNGGHE